MYWDQLLANAVPERHLVQLYQADELLLTRNVSRYLLGGLRHGDGLVVVAATSHIADITLELNALGADTEVAKQQGRLFLGDAQEMLAGLIADGQPDWDRFEGIFGSAVRQVSAWASNSGVRTYNETAAILWKEGLRSSAIRLEQLWNKLIRSTASSLFCAYPVDVFDKDFQIAEVDGLLFAHTHLLPSAIDSDLESSVDRAMDEILGSKADRLRPLIKANYRPSWATIPKGEALILWLRSNLPDHADEVLSRARQHYRVSQGTATMRNEHH